MGESPRSGSGVWLGSWGVIAVLLTACGSSTTAPHRSPAATVSPSAAPAIRTLQPFPATPAIPPLVGYASLGTFDENLYNKTGVVTAKLSAKPPIVLSPLGDRLLAEETDFIKGDFGVNAIVAMTSTGATSPLETFSNPTDFVDAIGSEDGTSWAWMVKGPNGGCTGAVARPAVTDVYMSSSPGSGTLIAKLPQLQDEQQWTFYRWTAAGIVLAEGASGCLEGGPPVNGNPTDLLNPTTGIVTPLGPKLGAGNCLLQDIADDGTMVCIPSATLFTDGPIGPSSTVLRIVLPGGAQRNVTAGQFEHGCDLKGFASVPFGDVTLDGEAGLVTLTRWCSQVLNEQTPAVATWIIDINTLNIAEVSVSGLGATGWLPGTGTLIATTDVGIRTAGVPAGTWSVASDGTATKLTSGLIQSECLEHD